MQEDPACLPVIVKLPAALVRLFPEASRQVEIPASVATVGDAIDALDRRWPGMRDRICDTMPSIRRHMNVFVSGERATLETRLAPGAEVVVLTAISGG
ncbi:molybdopterin converting factor small subunit [Skermanella aerolata]|uniref:MoaD/ThiS family protein n=1 Tax=Skermanella aerolata TaxID=393310 RepID=UPI003D245B7C